MLFFADVIISVVVGVIVGHFFTAMAGWITGVVIFVLFWFVVAGLGGDLTDAAMDIDFD